jgi:TfoX/Sxy family transcriptional regulator of competence genes
MGCFLQKWRPELASEIALIDRVEKALARRKGVTSKRMFGGIGVLLDGKLLAGVRRDSMMVRLSEDDARDALLAPFVQPFQMRGKPIRGWVLLGAGALESDRQLKEWLDQAVRFVGKLPPR